MQWNEKVHDPFLEEPDSASEESAETPAAESNDGEYLLRNYLLMEDVRKTRGMRMADRITGLDAEHCRLVLEQLANLHALGWVYKQKV